MRWIVLAVIVFLLVGGYIIYYELGADLKSSTGRSQFTGAVVGWLSNVGGSTVNVAKATASSAVSQDWLPKVNKTEGDE